MADILAERFNFPDKKNYSDQIRDTGVSRHHGSISNAPLLPLKPLDYHRNIVPMCLRGTQIVASESRP